MLLTTPRRAETERTPRRVRVPAGGKRAPVRHVHAAEGRNGVCTEFAADSGGRKEKALQKDSLSQIAGMSGSRGATIA